MTQKQSKSNLIILFCFLLSSSLFGQFQMNAVVSEPDANTTNVQLTVCEFTNMVSMQFSFNYNPDLVSYTASTDLNLSGLALANIANPSPGEITLSWIADDVVNGETVDDCTSIVTLLFDGTGSMDADYEFSGSPVSIEFSDSNGLIDPIQAVGPCACMVDGLLSFELDGPAVEFYPNPFSTEAHIKIDTDFIQNGEFRLINIVGQEVHVQAFTGNEFDIQTNALPAGSYLSAIYSDGQLIAVEKVLVK